MEYFTYFVLETIFIAKLIKVNPFGQNAVERVKNNTQNFSHLSVKINIRPSISSFINQIIPSFKDPAHFLYEELINYFFLEFYFFLSCKISLTIFFLYMVDPERLSHISSSTFDKISCSERIALHLPKG